ncbi:MAG: SlyX family protein [Spirochaetales bacterium]|nr:SlyX family protein [Spirochaetales bacterium]
MQEERIIALETKISYQEDLIQELNRIVADQERRLTREEERNRLMTEKIQELTEFLEEERVSRKPPHY